MERVSEQKDFLDYVKKYKNAMSFTLNEKSRIKKFLYGIQKFGCTYIVYHLSKYKPSLLFWNTSVRLFFGKKMILPSSDVGTHILKMYMISPHRCERVLTMWMIRYVKEDDVFYDVGTHLGFYTALAEHLASKGEVHAFEANEKLLPYLRKSFAHTKNVRIVETAVADVVGSVDFYDATEIEDSSASSRFNIVQSTRSPKKVNATTLDVYTKETHSIPTVIKLDIEGGEYDAICGALHSITQYKPTIIMEIWGGELGKRYSDKAVKKVQELGYHGYAIDAHGNLSKNPIKNPVEYIDGFGVHARDNFVFIPSS